MGWTAAAKKLANDALLVELATGSGTAAIKIYTSGATLLHTFAINTASSSVNETTGVLTLVEGTASTSVANGTGAYANIVSENNVLLYENMPVATGEDPSPGYCVVSSTSFTSGGTASLVSATIG